MKICIACSKKFAAANWECPSCAATPEMFSSYYAFAPSLAKNNDSFPTEYYDELLNAEINHFWFNARKDLIVWTLKKYFSQAKTFFEIGCGTGFILSSITKECKNLRIFGSDIHSESLIHTAKQASNSELMQMDARQIPFENEFDVIGAFDVLEHITEDTNVIQQIHKALKPNGGLLLTVPQHPFLWSKTDEYLKHVRRYTKKDLKNKLLRAGFRITRMTSFISFLLPLVAISRLIPQKNYHHSSELKLSHTINLLFKAVCSVELRLIKKGINLPIGSSLLIVAEKIPY